MREFRGLVVRILEAICKWKTVTDVAGELKAGTGILKAH